MTTTLGETLGHNRWANERMLEARREQIPTSVVLVQAINHATERWAHAATIPTHLGIEPHRVDGWTFGGFD